MKDFVTVTGMVLKAAPVGEYDRRLVILTKERGKITAFARGARRQNSRLMAGTSPFSFGSFKLYEGRSAYNLMEADISNYFASLREDFEGAYLGMYFMEYADYYAQENNDESELLKLLYQSFRAIVSPAIDNRLVRYIFEIRALSVNGEFPGVPEGTAVSGGCAHALAHIVSEPIERLYTFCVTEEILRELSALADGYRRRFIDRPFQAVKLLDSLGIR